MYEYTASCFLGRGEAFILASRSFLEMIIHAPLFLIAVGPFMDYGKRLVRCADGILRYRGRHCLERRFDEAEVVHMDTPETSTGCLLCR